MNIWMEGTQEELYALHKMFDEHHKKNMNELNRRWNHVLSKPENYVEFDLHNWLLDNALGDYTIPPIWTATNYKYDPDCICFDRDEDAMAYKLKWL